MNNSRNIIVILDDSPDSLTLTSSQLVGQGVHEDEITMFSRADEALHFIRRNSGCVRAFVSDFELGNATFGTDVIAQALEFKSNLFCILMSHAEVADKAHDLGVPFCRKKHSEFLYEMITRSEREALR